MISPLSIAKQVRQSRKELGISQADLAGASGVSRYTVMRFEKDGGGIGADDLFRMIEAVKLKVTVEPDNDTVGPR